MSEQKLSQTDAIAHALSRMTEQGLDYGSFFKAEFLKEIAGPWGSEKNFHFFMIGLIVALRKRGMYLTSAELGGTGWRVAQAVEHYHVSQMWRNDAERAYDRAIELLTNTRRDSLTEAEKIRDDNAIRVLTYERKMLQRSEDVIKVVKKNKPTIFKEDIEMEAPADPSAPAQLTEGEIQPGTNQEHRPE